MEVGFGTGLNALLTWKWAEKKKTAVHFYTLKPYPIPEIVQSKMDLYSDVRFNQLQEAGRNQEVRLSEYFALEKWIKRLVRSRR